MRWSVGVLTWNRPEDCRETLGALKAGLSGDYDLHILDNGSDVPFRGAEGESVYRVTDNLGAGGGVSELAAIMLDLGAEAILFLEDDWTLERPLDLESLEPILADLGNGQIRLGVRPRKPSPAYWTYALEGAAAERSLRQANSAYFQYAGGEFQLARLLWSNNPFACRREVAERFLLTGLPEIQVARPYLESGLTTASTTPGHFRHRGEIRARRGEPGWKA